MLSLLIPLYRQAEDNFFRSVAHKCLNLGDGSYAYMTGALYADLNFVYITKNTYPLDKVLAQSQKFYDRNNLPFTVIIPQELCTLKTKYVFNTKGYLKTGQSVAMVVKLDTLTIDNATTCAHETLIQASDDQLLHDWMIPLKSAYDAPFAVISHYASNHQKALNKHRDLYHFILYKQEKPIASMTLSILRSIHNNTLARIDDVGVLPEHQRQGHATRLMTHALSEAKKLNAHYCFLEASDSGLHLYKKLGFKSLFKNNIYSKQR